MGNNSINGKIVCEESDEQHSLELTQRQGNETECQKETFANPPTVTGRLDF